MKAILAVEKNGGIGYEGSMPWPKQSKELQKYLDEHELSASITKFSLNTKSNGLEDFGIARSDSCSIQLTLTCKIKE